MIVGDKCIEFDGSKGEPQLVLNGEYWIIEEMQSLESILEEVEKFREAILQRNEVFRRMA